MDTTLVLHLLFVAGWASLALVEGILEVMRRRDSSLEFPVGKVHYYIDIFVEVPLITGILVTGCLLLDLNRLSGLVLIKVVSGTVAILMTYFSVFVVLRRKHDIDAENNSGVVKGNRLFDTVIGPVVGVTMPIAFWLGMYLLFYTIL